MSRRSRASSRNNTATDVQPPRSKTGPADSTAPRAGTNHRKRPARKRRFRKRLFQPFQRKQSVGAAPGSIQPGATARPTRIERMVYSRTECLEEIGLSAASLQNVQAGVQWINVVGLADVEALQRIAKTYGLHPLLLEDIVHTHQRPKTETIQGRLVMILRMTDQQIPLHLEQVTLVLCGHTVLSFQERPGDSFEPVRERIRQSAGRVRQYGADYLFYCLLDAVLDAYYPLLEEYGRELEALEDEVSDNPQQETQLKIRDSKRELAALRKACWAQREAVARLLAGSDNDITETTQLFLRDCADHATHILEVTESFRDVVTDMRDLYFTQLSQRTNDVMKVLTVISTTFMPMTFIAGVYGMNFDADRSPWNMPETRWRFGYLFAWGLMIASAAVMVTFFVKRGWLFRRR